MQIKGFFLKELFRNQLNGYCIFILRTDEADVTCAGTIQEFPHYTPLKLEGEFGENPAYPDTFCLYEVCEWDDEKCANVQYIAYGMGVPNMTIEIAEKMADVMSGGLYDSVKDVKDAKDFSSLFPRKYEEFAKRIYHKVQESLSMKELFDAVLQIGGNYSDAQRLNEKYQGAAVSMLKERPYWVGLFDLEWNFMMCDNVAKMYGFSAHSMDRAKGILYYAMTKSLNGGDTYATLEELEKYVWGITHNSALGPISFSYVISFAITEKAFHVECHEKQLRVSFQNVHDAEEGLVKNISRILQSSERLVFNDVGVSFIEEEKKIVFSEGQKKAFQALGSTGIKIITGGPGCGKTTVIDGMIRYIKEFYEEEVCLCAPTGCAAQHMSEKSGVKASTFHYLLGVRPFESGCTPDFNLGNPLPYKFFIMDEFSMADIEITSLLFAAIPNKACVIIVGDVGQLESVGPGDVLADFVESGLFETYHLNTLFRQKAGSRIITNAKKAQQGESDFEKGSDFLINMQEEEMDTVKACIDYMKNRAEGCQVLCPVKKSEAGTQNINMVLQTLRHKGEKSEKVYGNYAFFTGDKVITVKNNRKQGYFNGEPGRIALIDEGGMLVHFANGDETYIKNAYLSEVVPANALTVHKAQGSEYKEVVLLLTQRSIRMINRRILYTAITRAKEKVTIFMQNGVLDCIPEARKRKTELADHLLLLY